MTPPPPFVDPGASCEVTLRRKGLITAIPARNCVRLPLKYPTSHRRRLEGGPRLGRGEATSRFPQSQVRANGAPRAF